MTTIKATCPDCGEVSLAPTDIDLRVDPSGTHEASYSFRCPECTDTVRKPADDRVVRLLVSGGVSTQRPAGAEPRLAERFTGPALTYNDLLDFHELLARSDWFDRLKAAADSQ